MTECTIRLFQEVEGQECGYLPNRQSRNLFVDPNSELDQHLLDSLNLNGFRRSGQLLYRPNCPTCNACKATRVLCYEFKLSKSHKRILKRNADLRLSIVTPQDTEEFYTLYERYIALRHQDGEMYPPSRTQYSNFLCSDYGNTGFFLAHQGDELVACMVFDQFSDALSAVYCFYQPELEQRSLGRFMIINLITLTRALNMPYNYLGYWVEDCDKMDYKKNYRPLEIFSDGGWQKLV